ncbi:hypothetical protein GZH46_02479 [Fragariocoptes setiger]|uniref:3CxxC-type domain-containing protein n=1 Tax=Fragariocoptes setiger TaxID=1670756 RepID=A0ABQ7S6F6_9ACAR|nr:hypothetical protein GZH46_02479 [Fragariocoptes setiger]
MDRVWQQEFQKLFSAFSSTTIWTIQEVESRPVLHQDQTSHHHPCFGTASEPRTTATLDANNNRFSYCANNNSNHHHKSDDNNNKLRLFVDSAKVRFCCDVCGHGWTSMKGRVVIWFDVFHVPAISFNFNGHSAVNHLLFGFCAFKLYGQQCDQCQDVNRFERPMWYPEEVTKVINNFYQRVGVLYYGFKAPAIDRQRRSGKPKTSHNSTLCQACKDGFCSDRK